MALPLDSIDPAIAWLERHYTDIVAQMQSLRTSLVAYGAEVHDVESRPSVSPQEHYSMLDSPDCGCPTCADWEMRRAEFVDVMSLVPSGHKWSICGCTICRFIGRVQLNFLAAANRRDLLIEISFHARYHSRHGAMVMAWLEREMQNPAYTLNWWAQEMSRFPVERWMRRCELAVSGVLSGAVFCEAAGVTDTVSHIGSSLGAGVGSIDGVTGWA